MGKHMFGGKTLAMHGLSCACYTLLQQLTNYAALPCSTHKLGCHSKKSSLVENKLDLDLHWRA